MFRSPYQIITPKDNYMGKKRKVKFALKVQMHAEPTAHSTPGNVFYVSLFRTVVDCGLVLGYLERTFIFRPLPPPPLGGGSVPKQGLMSCLKKVQDFRYQSIMYVNPCPPLPCFSDSGCYHSPAICDSFC